MVLKHVLNGIWNGTFVTFSYPATFIINENSKHMY